MSDSAFPERFPERLHRLVQAAATKTNLTLPADAAELLAAVLASTKTSTGRTWRVIARPRKDASERVRSFHAMLEWHSGRRGNNLGTAMMAAMRVGAGFDEIDSLAQLTAWLLTGRPSAPADAWNRALFGR